MAPGSSVQGTPAQSTHTHNRTLQQARVTPGAETAATAGATAVAAATAVVEETTEKMPVATAKTSLAARAATEAPPAVMALNSTTWSRLSPTRGRAPHSSQLLSKITEATTGAVTVAGRNSNTEARQREERTSTQTARTQTPTLTHKLGQQRESTQTTTLTHEQ